MSGAQCAHCHLHCPPLHKHNDSGNNVIVQSSVNEDDTPIKRRTRCEPRPIKAHDVADEKCQARLAGSKASNEDEWDNTPVKVRRRGDVIARPIVVMTSSSDDEIITPRRSRMPRAPLPTPPSRKSRLAINIDDDGDDGGGSERSPKPSPPSARKLKIIRVSDDDDDDGEDGVEEHSPLLPSPKRRSRKRARSSSDSSPSSDSESFDDAAAHRRFFNELISTDETAAVAVIPEDVVRGTSVALCETTSLANMHATIDHLLIIVRPICVEQQLYSRVDAGAVFNAHRLPELPAAKHDDDGEMLPTRSLTEMLLEMVSSRDDDAFGSVPVLSDDERDTMKDVMVDEMEAMWELAGDGAVGMRLHINDSSSASSVIKGTNFIVQRMINDIRSLGGAGKRHRFVRLQVDESRPLEIRRALCIGRIELSRLGQRTTARVHDDWEMAAGFRSLAGYESMMNDVGPGEEGCRAMERIVCFVSQKWNKIPSHMVKIAHGEEGVTSWKHARDIHLASMRVGLLRAWSAMPLRRLRHIGLVSSPDCLALTAIMCTVCRALDGRITDRTHGYDERIEEVHKEMWERAEDSTKSRFRTRS